MRYSAALFVLSLSYSSPSASAFSSKNLISSVVAFLLSTFLGLITLLLFSPAPS
jgi:hypothetical protein